MHEGGKKCLLYAIWRVLPGCKRDGLHKGTKVITYTLASEDGASLKASNFQCEGLAGGARWTGKRCRDTGVPEEQKLRWTYYITRRNYKKGAE